MKCKICGATENILHHHIDYENDITIPLCSRCHGKVHRDPVVKKAFKANNELYLPINENPEKSSPESGLKKNLCNTHIGGTFILTCEDEEDCFRDSEKETKAVQVCSWAYQKLKKLKGLLQLMYPNKRHTFSEILAILLNKIEVELSIEELKRLQKELK